MSLNICRKQKGNYFSVTQWPNCPQILAKWKGNLTSVGLTAKKVGFAWCLTTAQCLTWWLAQWLHLCWQMEWQCWNSAACAVKHSLAQLWPWPARTVPGCGLGASQGKEPFLVGWLQAASLFWMVTAFYSADKAQSTPQASQCQCHRQSVQRYIANNSDQTSVKINAKLTLNLRRHRSGFIWLIYVLANIMSQVLTCIEFHFSDC